MSNVGLKGSGSTESVNRLAVIMLLTLSIVTLAAVQGYTGTLVDERTVDSTVGGDIQITFENQQNETEALAIFDEIYNGDKSVIATTVPSLLLKSPDGDFVQTFVLLDDSDDVLHWSQQSVPGKDISDALTRYSEGGFSAGEDSAFTLDLAGSWSDQEKLDDVLLSEGDERSMEVVMTYEELTFNFISGGFALDNLSDFEQLFELYEMYSAMMEVDLSGVDFSGQDLSYRELARFDFTGANLSGANLEGANLSESLMVGVDLTGANLVGANLVDSIFFESPDGTLENANLTGSDLTGVFGDIDLSVATLGNATCPDSTIATETNCGSGASQIPPPLAQPLFQTGTQVEVVIIPHNATIKYMGLHEYIPGVSSPLIADSIIIGESSWEEFVGSELVNNHTSTNWIYRVSDVDGDALKALGSRLEADSRVANVLDWTTEHEAVERNGGLIFGTPGLLSLQFVVASIAAVASSFVFLSLVLNQRKKELAVLQAIGASPTQILRLVLFEILSIIIVSMLLGLVLGIGLAFSFNGFFDVFGFIFQLFGGASTNITRELVYPWFELTLVSISVFTAVVIALLMTTRRALKSDLAMVLKGE